MKEAAEPASIGFHIAAETVWIATTSPEGDLLSDQVDRVVVKGGDLSVESALSELEETIEHILGHPALASVGLLKAGTSGGPVRLTPIQRRAWIEAH